MYIGGQWVRVCDDGWDDSEAGVVCRQLGFGSSGRAIHHRSSGNQEITVPNFSCSGNESMLLNCSHRGIRMPDCSHLEEVEVACNTPVPGMYYSICFALCALILTYTCGLFLSIVCC